MIEYIYWQVLSFIPCREYPAWLAGFWNVCLFWGSLYLMSGLPCLIKMLLKYCFVQLFTFHISIIYIIYDWMTFYDFHITGSSCFLFPSSSASNDILSLIAVPLIMSALVAKILPVSCIYCSCFQIYGPFIQQKYCGCLFIRNKMIRKPSGCWERLVLYDHYQSCIFIGPESDHWLCLSLTDWLTH